MKPGSQVMLGVLTALISSLVLVGSLWLTLAEGGRRIALAPTQPPPSPTRPVITQAPGEPTFTPSATLRPTERPTATLPPPPTNCPPPPGWQALTVGLDDTLESLAQDYGTTAQELAQANCLVINGLPAGSLLYVPPVPPSPTPTATFTDIPPSPTEPDEPTQARPTRAPCGPPASWVTYIVRPNDTLSGLAQILGVSTQRLQQANCMGRSTVIRVGQAFWVPRLPPAPPLQPPTQIPPGEPTGRITPRPRITVVPRDTDPPPEPTAVPTDEPPPPTALPTALPTDPPPTDPPPEPTAEPPPPTAPPTDPPPIPTFPPPPATQVEPSPFPTFPPPGGG